MPRRVRDSNLETRSARSRLKVRHKPYYRLIAPGLHLGYRKLSSGPGTWISRRYNGAGTGAYSVENLRAADGNLIFADDYEDSDGIRILTFAQAQVKAGGARRSKSGQLTVSDVLDDYMRALDAEGRPPRALQDTRAKLEAHIRPQLGKLTVATLTAERLRNWRDELAKVPPRLRTPRGGEQKFRPASDDEEARRKRRASVNRTWTILRAALNRAFHDGKIESDLAWRRVKPFTAVDSARSRYLTVAEASRLTNACDPEFRPLVQAALQTGMRYGELVRLKVHDFDVNAGTIAVRKSKTGKPRHVILSPEGVGLFGDLVAGKLGDDLILTRSNGEPWGRSHQGRPMADAVKRAKITPPIGFHGLRHSYASLAVMNGMPMQVLAKNLGHTTVKMIEQHYGHLSASYIADTVRKHAPSFGYEPNAKVTSIR